MSHFEMTKLLFPSFIYHSSLINTNHRLRQLNKELLKEAYQFKSFDEKGHEWCKKNYPGGYTSYGSITNLHELSPTFLEFKNHLDKHVKKYIKHLEMDVNPKQIKLSSLWINIMPSHVVHTNHIHPLSVISGTYYADIPVGASALKFEDPRLAYFMATPPRLAKARQDNQWYYHFKPKVGQVVLFESWMRHEVPPNQAKKDRVSFSFNYDWV